MPTRQTEIAQTGWLQREALSGPHGAMPAMPRLSWLAPFSSGEAGHLQALANLNAAMTAAGDANVSAPYTSTDLNSLSINKPQCK
jgi:hypothetical protein